MFRNAGQSRPFKYAMLESLKPYVDKVPLVSGIYRGVRDEVRSLRLRPIQTKLGFKFAGDIRMQKGSFEPEEVAFISKQLVNMDVFVDVGANIGYYTCIARAAGKHVIAIEPLDHNLKCLYRNLEANAWADVEVFPLGVSSEPGLVNLYGGGTGASLIGGWAGGSATFRRTIPVSTLDIVLGERFAGRKLLVKVDVEGGEQQVLAGAIRTLSTSPAPLWLLEICLTEHHPGGLNALFAETFATFRAHGYTAWTVGFEREVLATDVARWVKQRGRDFGSHNFVFSRDHRF